jgi:formylglycine-generating enzyme required for sulfatase activity
VRYPDFSSLLKDLSPLHKRSVGGDVVPEESDMCGHCGYVPYQPAEISRCPLCGGRWREVRRERARLPRAAVTPAPSSAAVEEAIAAVTEYLAVPGGGFVAGCPETELNRYPLSEDGRDLLRERAVEVGPFRIAKYAVTNSEYLAFVRATGQPRPSHWRADLERPYSEEMAHHPVVNVSWEDAIRYCRWKRCRLPTRDEWEKAAGWEADTKVKRRYPWGSDFSSERCNTTEGKRGGTAAVEEYAEHASPCGAVQMAGNVWEWIDGGQGGNRFIRGSSFKDEGEHQGRVYFNVASASREMRSEQIGFRCVDDAFGTSGQLHWGGGGAQVEASFDRAREYSRWDEEVWEALTGGDRGTVAIEGGSFEQGCRRETAERLLGGRGLNVGKVVEAARAEEVSFASFRIARYPVANLEYWHFVKAARHRAPEHWDPIDWPLAERDPSYRPFWKFYSLHPVVNVSLDDARAFCRWKGVRLPTAREWERAARGPSSSLWPWGDEFDAGRCNSLSAWWGRTTPVYQHSRGASPEGAVDMIGNVYEWLDDGDARGGSWRSQCEIFGLTFISIVGFRPEAVLPDLGFRYAV